MASKTALNLGPSTKKKNRLRFRLSLRYKLALPVLVLVILMILLLFRTTFRTVRTLVMERTESRLKAVTEVFVETVKVPMILHNQQVLAANVEWMSNRQDVIEVRVEDADGIMVGGNQSVFGLLPDAIAKKDFLGVRKINPDTYAVAVPIKTRSRKLGRVLIVFSQLGFEAELREIFQKHLLLAFLMAMALAFLTAGLTWLAIRPLFHLKRTVEEILAGNMAARARIDSFDEIQDLGDAFNEMVARLGKSLENLRARTEALEESEEKFRLIVENASDIIFTLTPQGDLVLLNKGFSGCTLEELLGDGFPLLLALHTEESRKKFSEALETVCTTKQPVTNIPITHIHRGNQSEIFYLTNLTGILDQEGNVKLIQAVMRDVTELRRIDMMKDSLIRDVAHELKTPTAKFEMAINWFEKEIKKDQNGKKFLPIIGILRNNTDRLTRTITSIMDLSRLESGAEQIVATELDLNEVLHQVAQDMKPICEQKGILLEDAFSREPLRMKGDRDMLYRLFVNLIGNALKFTDRGKITLKSQNGGGSLYAEVDDTGIGIEKQDLEMVFERFFQKTAASTGIGVGLTISRDIVALHQGKIWAESKGLGKGATFKVEFPPI